MELESASFEVAALLISMRKEARRSLEKYKISITCLLWWLFAQHIP